MFKASPLASILREEKANSDSQEHITSHASANSSHSAAFELIASEHDIDEEALKDFYPAKQPPPNEDVSTWDVPLEGSHLEHELKTVFSLLDEFGEAPPFTVQRFAELVLEPQQHYHTRSKYLAALRRVLSVTVTAKLPQPEPEEPDSLSAALELRFHSDSQPMFSSIPFLESSNESQDAPASISQKPNVHDSPMRGGRVDELDSQETPGSVLNEVQPLSATTYVETAESTEADTPEHRVSKSPRLS